MEMIIEFEGVFDCHCSFFVDTIMIDSLGVAGGDDGLPLIRAIIAHFL